VRLSGLLAGILCFAGALFAQTQLQITTASLPGGAVGTTYSQQQLQATGGSTPYNWSVTQGAIPTGLTLSSSGAIDGTPTTAGTFNFTVTVTDNSSIQQTASKALSITISQQLTITTTSLPLGVVGVFYSRSLEAAGLSPVSWSVVSRILPPGLTLASNGSLFGTPSVAGTFDFTVQATGGTPVQTATRDLQIVVNGPLTITTPSTLPDASLSGVYSVTLATTGGLPPYVWTNLGQNLPPGLSLSSGGVLSGTPASLGTFGLTLQVADSFSPTQTAARNFSLSVTTPLTITTPSLPSGFQNLAYSQQLQATGTSPFSWSVSAGTLPEGLTLSTGGLLQGTPVNVGSSSLTVTVTDARGTASSKPFVLVVDPPLSSFSVIGLPATLNPARTQDIGLSLASPHSSPLTGTLVLSFTSKAENPSDDPMTVFSNGSRMAGFTIPANTTSAVFPSNVVLMTGTVAGTVRLTVNIQNGPSDLSAGTVEIVATAPQISSATASRTSGGLEIQITGYAPSRRVTNVEFTFELKVGKKTSTVTLSRNAEADFDTWFRNPASTVYGASFSFVQSFAVQGDTSAVQAVTIRLTNAQGSTSSTRIPLQ
jgi:Putative Ig domain